MNKKYTMKKIISTFLILFSWFIILSSKWIIGDTSSLAEQVQYGTFVDEQITPILAISTAILSVFVIIYIWREDVILNINLGGKE